MSRFRACGWGGGLAMAVALLGAGCGSEPETPPEQATPAQGQEMMDKLKSMQSGTMTPGGGGPQNAMEKMKSMSKGR